VAAIGGSLPVLPTEPRGGSERMGGMPNRRVAWRPSAGPMRPSLLVAVTLAVVVAACGAPSPTATPVPAPTPTNVPTPVGATPAPPDLPAGPAPGPAAYADAPTGCLGLEAGPCHQVKAAAADLVGDAPVVYVEVGPFYCPTANPCPRTLEGRPGGEITIETADGGQPIAATVRWDGTKLEVAPAQSFNMSIVPQSQQAVGGRVAIDLGHCGLFSGIDLDASWWDPVGFVDADHPDAINSARAVVTAIDEDHAALLTAGGLAVQLVRRAGPKALRGCM
jgi:hypothetical protein